MTNGIDEQYIDLLKDILENGVKKDTRNGKVLSVFGRTIRYKFKGGKFPLLTTKRMHWNSIVGELIWFLRGETNIKWLVDRGINIWNGDAYAAYCKSHSSVVDGWQHTIPIAHSKESFIEAIKSDEEFAKKWGDMGPIYGAQWRKWKGFDNDSWINTDNMTDPLIGGRGLFYDLTEIDQIAELIQKLKNNPDDRRMLVSAWNPSQLQQMSLPPCHYGFQVWTRELTEDEKHSMLELVGLDPLTKEAKDKLWDRENLPTRAISLMWNQRSVDTPLGLPFNIASYALLLEMLAKEVNMVPDELIGNLGDTHIYENQIEGIKEQLTRTSYELPTVKIANKNTKDISEYDIEDIVLEGYTSHPTIKMPLSN